METKYTFKIVDTFIVSDDEDTRKEKLGKSVTVTFMYKDWTAQDLVNRLAVSNSPRVAVQAILRKMKVVPDKYEYIVPKVGQRVQQDFFSQLAAIVGMEVARTMSDTYGSAEEAIRQLATLMPKKQ